MGETLWGDQWLQQEPIPLHKNRWLETEREAELLFCCTEHNTWRGKQLSFKYTI